MARDISIITLVGGAPKYDTTTYEFEDGNLSAETTVFSNALIERYRKELKSIVYLGTDTSSWSSILPEPDNEEDDKLIKSLKENEAAVGSKRLPIKSEDFEKVRKRLKEYYTDFEVHVLQPQKSNINLEENPLAVYSKMIDYVEKTKIVFDISYGFKYMPLFMFESLQMSDFDADDITLLYAEKNDEKKNYIVRDISKIWRAAEVNKALYTFKTTLNGEKLSKYIIRAGEEDLGEWIFKFTEYIQKSYLAVCDMTFFGRLKDILERVNEEEQSFVRQTKQFLMNDILSRFDFNPDDNPCNKQSCFLVDFADLLKSKNLFTQALIALREALYIRLYENHDSDLIGTYLSDKELAKIKFYQDFDKKCREYKISFRLRELKNIRNLSAHAGIELIKKDKVPKINSKKYKKYRDVIGIVFKEIEPCREDVSGS